MEALYYYLKFVGAAILLVAFLWIVAGVVSHAWHAVKNQQMFRALGGRPRMERKTHETEDEDA